jgi:hypothetical protein
MALECAKMGAILTYLTFVWDTLVSGSTAIFPVSPTFKLYFA